MQRLTDPRKNTITSISLGLLLFLFTLPIFSVVNVEENRSLVIPFVIFLCLPILSLAVFKQGSIRIVLIAVYIYIFLLVLFQYPMLGLFCLQDLVQRRTLIGIMAIKSAVAFGVGLFFLNLKLIHSILFRKIKIKFCILDLVVLVLLGFSFVSFFMSPMPLEARLTYLIHSIGTFCIVFLLFRVYKLDKNELAVFGKVVIGVGSFLFVVGIIIYFNDYVWTDILKVHIGHAGIGQTPRGELPTWFRTGLGGYQFKRFVSLVGNPVTLGYVFGFGYVYSLLREKYLLIGLFFLATVLTLSKGALLLVLITSSCFVLRINSVKKMVGLNIIFITFAIYIALKVRSSAAFHLKAFLLASQSQLANFGLASIFGHGLGSGGSMAGAGGFLEGGWEATGGESALGTVIYQMGFLGGILFILFFVLCQYEILRYSRNKCDKTSKLSLGIASSLLVNFIFQENIINMTVYIPYLLFLAVSLNQVTSPYCRLSYKQLKKTR